MMQHTFMGFPWLCYRALLVLPLLLISSLALCFCFLPRSSEVWCLVICQAQTRLKQLSADASRYKGCQGV